MTLSGASRAGEGEFGDFSSFQSSATQPGKGDKFGAFKAFSSDTPPSTAVLVPSSKETPPQQGASGGGLDDEFGSFSSGPMPPQSSSFPITSQQAPIQGWADFSSFGSLPVASQALAAGDIPSIEPVSTGYGASAVSGAVTTTVSAVSTIASAVSTPHTTISTTAFDDILPKELMKSKKTEVVTESAAASSPTTRVKKPTRQMTGLEILEEEMSNRLSSSSAQSQAPPPTTNPAQSLVPEPVGGTGSGSTSSLENYGDFEGYSGKKLIGGGLESHSGSNIGRTKVRGLGLNSENRG